MDPNQMLGIVIIVGASAWLVTTCIRWWAP
jgi:hypothetical protein